MKKRWVALGLLAAVVSLQKGAEPRRIISRFDHARAQRREKGLYLGLAQRPPPAVIECQKPEPEQQCARPCYRQIRCLIDHPAPLWPLPSILWHYMCHYMDGGAR